MSVFYKVSHAVSSGHWFIVFKILTLKVAVLTTIFLHRSKLGLDSVADLLNTGVRSSTSAERALCLLVWRTM